MKESGCRRVYLGLETGNQDTLKLMKKKATLEEGKNAVQLFHKAGIEVAAFFIVGLSGGNRSRHRRHLPIRTGTPAGLIFLSMFPTRCPVPSCSSVSVKWITNKDWNEENEVTFVYESEFDSDWLRRRIGETMQAFADKKK